jgi:phosphatidylglycerol:prolipoprotein diacylglycerol transferase
MHPELLHVYGETSVHTYGFCLMLGFVTATWLAMRRAGRVKCDPQIVFGLALLAVLCGVGGARVFYVFHYWRDFADRANPLFAMFDIRQGGLEFLGGFVCATSAILIYLTVPRRISPDSSKRKMLPVRLYLDILTPSLILGLAITRIGCFSNGCCFGTACVNSGTREAKHAWVLRFPYGSPTFVRQWEGRRTTVPAELIWTSKRHPLPRLLDRALVSRADTNNSSRILVQQRKYRSRTAPSRGTSPAELKAFAAAAWSLPTHPTQLYASINALLLSFLLAALFYVRKRHGVVFVALFLLYAPSRFILEILRADNPRDTFGLTISQFVSVVMFAVGVVALIGLYKYLPERATEGASAHREKQPPSQPQRSPQKHRKKRRS